MPSSNKIHTPAMCKLNPLYNAPDEVETQDVVLSGGRRRVMPRMKRARVYFAPQILGVVENIQVNTGIKTYTDVISLIVERYEEDFINSYNNFRCKPKCQKIDLSKLEGFRE